MGPMHLRVVGLVIAAIATSGCAVPLGPGVRVGKENLALEMDAAPGSTQFEVQARLRVRNTGNRALPSLTIALPPAARIRRVSALGGNARVVGEEARITFSFAPLWAPRAVQRLDVTYELQLPAAPIAVAPESWLLRVQRPPGLLASGNPTAERLHIEVSGPAGWMVILGDHCERLPATLRPRAIGVGLRDPEPVLVAGAFSVQLIRGRYLGVRLLTQKPCAPEAARRVSAEIEQSYDLFRRLLGRLPYRLRALTVVEATPVGMGTPEGAARGSVIVMPAATLEKVLARGMVDQQADRLVARLWIGGALRARPDQRPLLEEGALEFLLLRAREVRSGSSLLEQAEGAARREYRELERAPEASRRSRAEALRGMLFFLELDRQLGPQPVEQALGMLARLQDGRPVGLGELRAALEQLTGRDLGELFERWSTLRTLPRD
jgi:hypothetical protein